MASSPPSSTAVEKESESESSSSNNKITTKEDINNDNNDYDIFIKIVQCPIPFKSTEEENDCNQILNLLTEQEKHQTACTSYAYWRLLSSNNEDKDKYEDKEPNDDENQQQQQQLDIKANYRDHMSLKEIRRHYVGEDSNINKALIAIREALNYRKEYQIDELRYCFYNNDNDGGKRKDDHHDHDENNDNNNINGHDGRKDHDDTTTTNNNLSKSKLEELIYEDLKYQIMVVRGYNKNKCGIAYKFGRNILTEETNIHGYLLANIYIAERLLAYTEYISLGKQEKLIVIFDFNGYDSQHKPPIDALKIFTTMLQRIYPERLQTLVVLHPPFWMKVIYNILYYLLSYDTRTKLQMATSIDDIDKIFNKKLQVDNDHAMPLIRKDGKLSSDINNLDKYLYDIPFYLSYDD